MNAGVLPARVATRAWGVWIAAVAGAIVLAADQAAAAVVVALVSVAMLLSVRTSAWQVPALLAVVAGGADAERLLPWVLAGGALVLLLAERERHLHGITQSPIGPAVQLDRSRRRGEHASVVVVSLPDARGVVDGVLETVRTTDGFAVRRTPGGVDVLGVLDGGDVERAAVERRIRDAVPDIAPQFGWAMFPEDGLTLEVLIERAAGRSPNASRATGPSVVPAPSGTALGARDEIAAEAS